MLADTLLEACFSLLQEGHSKCRLQWDVTEMQRPGKIVPLSDPTATAESGRLTVGWGCSPSPFSLAAHRPVTVKPNVWPFFHQRADNNSKAQAKATSLKRSYEIISLCKSIKIASDSLSIGRLRGRAEVVGLWCARFNEIPLLLRSSLQIFHISAWERFDAFLPVPRVNWKHFRINSAPGPTLGAHHYS